MHYVPLLLCFPQKITELHSIRHNIMINRLRSPPVLVAEDRDDRLNGRGIIQSWSRSVHLNFSFSLLKNPLARFFFFFGVSLKVSFRGGFCVVDVVVAAAAAAALAAGASAP